MIFTSPNLRVFGIDWLKSSPAKTPQGITPLTASGEEVGLLKKEGLRNKDNVSDVQVIR